MAFYKTGIGGLPTGVLGNGKIVLLGADDTIGSLLPGPTDGAMAAGDGVISIGGDTQAATGGRILTNRGFPVVLDAVQSAAGAAYNTSTAPTNVEGALLGPAAYPLSDVQPAGTFAPGRLNLVGRTLRVRAWGQITNAATPALTMAVLLGTTVIGTTAAQTMATITGTALWKFESESTVRVAGASGTVMTSGLFTYFTTSRIVSVTWAVQNTTPFTADTVDLTVAKAVHLQATWGTSSGSNNLTVHQAVAEVGY
jgi:hypothetical protein